MKKVYISGKITGLPYETAKQHFAEAALWLQEQGYATANPFDNGLPPSASWAAHMKADLKMMLECDTLLLLQNWKDSKGAKIERALARELGFEILECTFNNTTPHGRDK